MGGLSRRKGAKGERRFRDFLIGLGFEARRGRQYSGDPSAPDVVTNIDGVHFEVKYVKSLHFHKALAQAKADAGGNVPVVAWSDYFGDKPEKNDWYLIVRGSDLMRFCDNILKSRCSVD